MDSFIYALVLVPALTELLPRSGKAATWALVVYYGAVLPEFAPGEHHITVVYWKMEQTRDQASQFDWTFKVS